LDVETSAFEVSSITKSVLQLEALFPNPANNLVNIRYSLKNKGDVNWKIRAVSGLEIIGGIEKTLQPGHYSNTINVSHLPKGIYTLEILFNGNVAVSRKVAVE